MTFGSKNAEEDSEAKAWFFGLKVCLHIPSGPVVSWPNKGPSQGRLVAESKLSLLDLKMHNGTITRLYKKVFPHSCLVFPTINRGKLAKIVQILVRNPTRF